MELFMFFKEREIPVELRHVAIRYLIIYWPRNSNLGECVFDKYLMRAEKKKL